MYSLFCYVQCIMNTATGRRHKRESAAAWEQGREGADDDEDTLDTAEQQLLMSKYVALHY
jgi:hypothetical protein